MVETSKSTVMSLFRHLLRIVSDEQASAELTHAQWHVLRRQVPLMYALLLTNTLVLAATYYSQAPDILTLYLPLTMAALCIFRIRLWWRIRASDMTTERARRDIRGMSIMGPPIAAVFTIWGLSLYPYGNPFQQAHIAFYMGIITIVCMFCLLSVRKAALLIGACVMVPFTGFFALTGQPTFVAIAMVMCVIFGVLTVLLLNNYRVFSGLVASRREVTLKQEQTQQLLEENHRLARLDSLTGIDNRRSFQQRLDEELSRAKQEGRKIAVARLNIDRFKAVNDIFGQVTGDRVLVEIAQRLDAVRPRASFLARLDSDNFAVIFFEASEAHALCQIGQRLGDAIARPYHMPLGTVHITASIGVAASGPSDTAETLYDHADYAGWVARREARGSIVVFSAIDAHNLRQARRMEHLLHTANLEEEIYIVLQPQFDIALGAITGFEVLARWRSAEIGEVSPGDFIPMAERTGHICAITQIVLRKALAVGERLPRHVRLSVNLSANDLCSPAAIDAIIAIIGEAEQTPRIDFEITETAVMRDLDQAEASLTRLLSLGARIALDDFGTGHSSLTHVQRLPLHRIKIDRSFVAEVTNDVTSRAIIKTIVDLCRNLGMSCVFEGVETEAQSEALVGLGGTVMQGYLFGRPMSVEDALASAATAGAAADADALYRYDAAS